MNSFIFCIIFIQVSIFFIASILIGISVYIGMKQRAVELAKSYPAARSRRKAFATRINNAKKLDKVCK